ncbi:MAG TPA: peptidoglycan DD-metalloendopeptidase family protein [Polyangia bacterium]|nr:peptidoglycan DD-metalloendopeptidase family protein [Polyangia bacterium]
MPRKRRKRRSAEIRNSLRLGLLLSGLVGINIYVFFFNRGTAPREVLKPAATAQAAGADDILKASAAEVVRRPQPPVKGTLGGPPRVAAPAGRTPSAHARPAAPAAFALPFAPPTPVVQIPYAPPEDDAPVDEGASQSQEKRFGTADTLGQVLAREGFGAATVPVIAAFRRLADPRSIRGGQIYRVQLDDDGAPNLFEYQPSPILRYVVEKGQDQGNDGWVARKLEQAVDLKTAEVAGVVDSSLYESVQKSGESTVLVSLLVELFAWDVNFYVDTHPGDHWKIVVEKQFLGGQFYKYGRLLAAEYGGRAGTFRAFYWKGNGAKAVGRYYDEHGQAITKTMLKTPLRYVRISSRFDRKRFHPILHVEKAHLGIDYAAPVGTPIWASASGRVVEAEMKRGSGNTVVIAHANGLSTRYYHLSRFARGLRVGQSVRQKDVIGFVGTTGLSTGPHLHFSVTKNGAFVDPSKLQISREPPVADRAAFLAGIAPRAATLKNLQPAALAKN